MTIIELRPRRKAKAKAKQAPARIKADWEAIRRDYRTGRYSLRELQAKHGADHGLISRKSRKEAWPQDLGDAIRLATNARLTKALVDAEVTESHQKVTAVVAAAADENTRIIMGHRARLTELAQAVDRAKASVLLLGASVTSIREAGLFMQSVCNLAGATRILLELERRAYSLDSTPERPQDEFADFLADLSARGSRLPIAGSNDA